MRPELLSREDYSRLIQNGVPERYPKRTSEAVAEIVVRGGMVNEATLTDMVAKGLVSPVKAGAFRLWSPQDIDDVLEHATKRFAFTPFADMFAAANCTARDFFTELHRVHEQLRSEWGDLAGEDPQPYDFYWTFEHQHPAKSRVRMTPSPATLARLDAILQQQEESVERIET